MKKILIIGKSGQVGWELQRSLAPLGTLVAIDSPEINLANPQTIVEKLREIKPDIIVNAAAYTAVDKAEQEPEIAFAVNAKAPGVLAEEAKKIGAYLVHYSTDYVFDGCSPNPYKETDTPNPLGVYARSKLDGELTIQAAGCDAIILRTSWVYGHRGNNFMLTMLALAQQNKQLRVVSDQIGAPTWSRMLAQGTALILPKARREKINGIYHIACAGKTNWHEFATTIFDLHGIPLKIDAITTNDYPTPAKRPKNSLLNQDKLEQDFCIRLPDWRHALNYCFLDRKQH